MRVMFAIVVWCTQLSVHPTYWIVAIGNASYNFMLAALDQCQCGGGAFASGVIYITPLANGFWNLWYWTIAGMQKAPVFAICCFIFVEMSKLCFRICKSLCIDIDSWPMIWDPLWYLLLYSLHLIDSFVDSMRFRMYGTWAGLVQSSSCLPPSRHICTETSRNNCWYIESVQLWIKSLVPRMVFGEHPSVGEHFQICRTNFGNLLI